ncbi:MAG: wax ester/triacylglycerol synthase domain-containing protein [Candidatus Phosphoribacter sp.]
MTAADNSRQAWSAAAAAQWGQPDRMNNLETTMWRSERHPQHSSTVCTLMVLDRQPQWERLVAAHEWATQLVPRTRERVVEPLLPLGPPAWQLDPHFTLDYHVRRIELGTRHMFPDLLELAQTLAIAPFDRNRPLWEATLIEGLEGGRAAYLLKLHHSLTDGIGVIQLISAVQSRTRRHTPNKPTRPPNPADSAQLADPSQASGSAAATAGRLPEPDRLAVTLTRASELIDEAPRRARNLAGAALQWATDPLHAAGEGQRFTASLRRVLTPTASGASPLFERRDGRRWLFRTLECPMVGLRGAGRAAGGSINDAYVAALLGGMRIYHEQHATPLEQLSVTVPVSLRRTDDPMGGNRFAGLMFAAPVGTIDPAERIAEVRGAILTQLSEPAVDTYAVLTPIVNWLPSSVGAAVIAGAARADLAASNVPGPTEQTYLAGARVERIFAFGPLPGVAVMAVLLSHLGTACIGLTIDGAAVPDPDVLVSAMQQGIDEVLGLAPAPSRGSRK